MSQLRRLRWLIVSTIAALLLALGSLTTANAAGVTVALDASQGPAGGSVMAHGDGWAPNTTVHIAWDNGETSPWANSDANGHFDAAVNIPPDMTPGLHPIFFSALVGVQTQTFSVAFTVTLPPGESAPPTTCPDAGFIGFRGSGEPPGLGDILPAYVKSIKQKYHGTVDERYLNYPAVDVAGPLATVSSKLADANASFQQGQLATTLQDSWSAADTAVKTINSLADSVNAGATEAVIDIREIATACPKEKIVLAGYSQGALALHLALSQLDSSLLPQVAFVFFLGDPWFDFQNTKGVATTAAAIASAAGIDSSFIPPNPYVPSALSDRFVSWCAGQDPVCHMPSQIGDAIVAVIKAAPRDLVLPGPDLLKPVIDAKPAIDQWAAWLTTCGDPSQAKLCQHFHWTYDMQADFTADDVLRQLG